MKKNYCLGSKATICIVPKHNLKMLKNKVYLLESTIEKNLEFRSRLSGGQIRSLTETEARELVEDGYELVDKTKKAEAKKAKVEKGDPEIVTLKTTLAAMTIAELTLWAEEQAEDIVSVELYEAFDAAKKKQEKLDVLYAAIPAELLNAEITVV